MDRKQQAPVVTSPSADLKQQQITVFLIS